MSDFICGLFNEAVGVRILALNDITNKEYRVGNNV